jgi:hypothetical protein
MSDFEFVSGGKELLVLVESLWEELNKHNEINSSNFSENFRNIHLR